MRHSAFAFFILGLATSARGQIPVVVPRDGIPNVMAEMKAGNAETIVFFGGSITDGAGASDHNQTSYRALVGRWIRQAFPISEVRNENAAIGGTGSELGVFRVNRDVISRKPDLVFIEFAVNDGGTPDATIDRAMEGIVRQIWKADPGTDIVFVYTFVVGQLDDFRKGQVLRTVARHEKIAAHYGIPSVNVAVPAAAKILDGSITAEAFAKDGVHPTDAGYRIYADAIIGFLEKQRDATTSPRPHPMPDPLYPDNLEQARMISPDGFGTIGKGWKIDEKSPVERFPTVLAASEPGAEQVIEFRGSTVGLYYAVGPDTGSLEYKIDDRPWKTFDPFDVFSLKYHRANARLLEDGLHNGKHAITLKVRAEHAKDSKGTTSRIGYLLVASDPKQE